MQIKQRGTSYSCKYNEKGEIKLKIAIVGTGYVGLSNAILLAQNNEVVAVDIIQEKCDLLLDKGKRGFTTKLA